MKLSNFLKKQIASDAIQQLYAPEAEAFKADLAAKVKAFMLARPTQFIQQDDIPAFLRPFVRFTTTLDIFRPSKADVNVNNDLMWAVTADRYRVSLEEADFLPEMKLCDQLNQRREDGGNEIKQLLASVNTAKQLREICPNLTQFLPPEEQGVLVPIQLIERVNKLFERKPK